jgi:hypothetical protein
MFRGERGDRPPNRLGRKALSNPIRSLEILRKKPSIGVMVTASNWKA